ncbi:Acetyltransferase (GNAT) family protein [Phycisphaerae bacterium RAS1]|nr:Acetyltransferase (GNAT) family protein [Phycisphaerae bacterium RAS1]
MRFTFRPLTPDRWRDLEALFGQRGACGGCWCMWWRVRATEFNKNKGDRNRAAFRAVVAAGPPPGLLAYAGAAPVGWCAVAPRQTYVRLATSRVLAPLDAQPVWSITCFFIAATWRRKGLSTALIRAAVTFARSHGAKIIEGYPVEPRRGAIPAAFAWTGLPRAFEKAGFQEATRRSPTRPIMRKSVRPVARAISTPPN